MSESGQQQSERYYVAYQRGAVVCLLAVVASGGYLVAGAFGRLRSHLVFDGAMMIIAAFFTALFVVAFVTMRGRLWRRSAPEAQLVLRDEWTRRNWNRACRTGFATVMWVQLPLAFFMDRLASDPSFSGMAGLSMTAGASAFFASYLYLGRQQGDG